MEDSAELFEAATVERMLGHYETLLRAAVAQPDTRIGALSLLSTAERDQLLSFGNDDDHDADDLNDELDVLADERFGSLSEGVSSIRIGYDE